MNTHHPESTAATLSAITAAVLADVGIVPRTLKGRKIAGALHDAFELGKISPTARTAVDMTDLLGPGALPPATPTTPGLMARVVHTIEPAAFAEHGPELPLLAYLQQSVRELAAHGAQPHRDMTLQVVGMVDGTTVVTGEAQVGGR